MRSLPAESSRNLLAFRSPNTDADISEDSLYGSRLFQTLLDVGGSGRENLSWRGGSRGERAPCGPSRDIVS